MERNKYTSTPRETNPLYSRRPSPYDRPYNGALPQRGYNQPYHGPNRSHGDAFDPYSAPSRGPYPLAPPQRALQPVPTASRERTFDRPYERRYDVNRPSGSNSGVRGNQVFDDYGRQYTHDDRIAPAASKLEPSMVERRTKPLKIYATNEEEYRNPELALKYTKPYDAYEKFYQFVIDRPPNAFEQRVIKLMDAVFSQPGVRSKLIFLESEEDKPLQTLQGSVDCCKSTLVMAQNELGEHVLSIDGEEICAGKFTNKQTAKNMLGEQALDILRRDCFFIIKKPDVYEDIDTDIRRTIEPGPGPSPFASAGSVAHNMMKKMGWAGKGLGAKEQGEFRPVAEIIDQNVTRRGLGLGKNNNNNKVFLEIARIFDDFKESAKISVLRFAPDFEKEERAYIHTMALKAGLKSKSEGQPPNRRITITQKFSREELVHSLLLIGCESALYQLIIPERFIHLWNSP